MGTAYLHGNGGSGGGLNFKIVGNPQPSNPKENTIWIDTDEKITGYYFAPTQPESMTEGEVWISIGTASQAAFNVLKKNGIQVYPLSAKQYIEGELVAKTAEIYKGNKWVNLFDGTLYSPGNEYEGITGGWIATAESLSVSSLITKEPTVTKLDSCMTMVEPQYGGNGNYGVLRTNNVVNLSDFKTLYFDVEGTGSWTDVVIGVANSSLTGFEASKQIAQPVENSNVSRGLYTVDVSAIDGSRHICIRCYNAATSKPVTLKIYNVYLK